MLPLDLVGVLKEELQRDQRQPDGLLHASSDLVGSLRHSQLKLAGAPMKPTPIAQQLRLATGTMWHNRMHSAIERTGIPFMQEVKLDRWLPEGWSGTADWLFYDDQAGGWVLGDMKTAKGEGMKWVEKDGAKTEHLWQLSAYWHALVEAGLPMVRGFAILYVPMNDTFDEEVIEPIVADCSPLSKDAVEGEMARRWHMCEVYLDSVEEHREYPMAPVLQRGDFLTDKLAAPMAREQKVVWNGKQGVFDVKLVPHWSTDFCPFETDLCDCSEQGVTKFGHYTLEGDYVPRKDYESIEPLVAPSASDYRKKRSATVSV